MSRPTARRAVARRAASRRPAAGRGARHREPGRPGAGCRTTDPGKPGSLPAEPRQSPGRPNQVQSQLQSQVRPAAGQWRGGPPGRRLPARSPGLRRAGQSPAADSRGLCTRAVRNRGSRGRSTRERRPRVAGSRIPRQAAAPRRSWDRRSGRRTRGCQHRGCQHRGCQQLRRQRLDRRKPGCRTESSGLRRTGPRNPDPRSRNRPRPTADRRDRCRRRTPVPPGTRCPAGGNRKARISRVRTAPPAVRPGLRAGRSLALIRNGPDCSWPHPNGDAALMAIHCHLEPANRSSYTGSLPCLSYSRSMITSIIATNETLCYLLG